MKKCLWASRHPMGEGISEALTELFFNLFEDNEPVMVISRDCLWPSDRDGCLQLMMELDNEYDVICGVFPAQAHEQLGGSDDLLSAVWISPVSEPVSDPDTGRVREFKFVRFAFMGGTESRLG